MLRETRKKTEIIHETKEEETEIKRRRNRRRNRQRSSFARIETVKIDRETEMETVKLDTGEETKTGGGGFGVERISQ